MLDRIDEATKTVAPKVRVARRGAVVEFTLDRPQALNAFDDEMCRSIADEIPRIARNPDIYIVALRSASPRAFCAGGDIRRIVADARADIEKARSYFRAEYAMNWLLDCFSKPTVSLIDGLCMGSGAGLTCFNTHRVAGERYAWAMPETGIGLFPDVGVAHVLSRMPWPVGLYLGLTGRSIDRSDAQWLKLTTHCIDASEFENVVARLADAEPVDALLDAMHQSQSMGALQSQAGMIVDAFAADTLDEIVRNLSETKGAGADFAAQTLEVLKSKSPLSLRLTDRHIRAARTLDLRLTLMQDYRLAVRCLEGHDFAEGVRAALIDKDRRPHWRPSSLDEVSDSMVDAYFAPLGADDLALPLRAEMQAARV